MQQFPCGGTAGHFLWLADLTQTRVEGLDHRVMLRRAQRRHVKGGAEAAVAGMPNGGPMPHTGSGLPWHRGQSGIGRQSVHGVTTRQVERGHQRPRRRDPADALDTLEARRGSGSRTQPLRIMFRDLSQTVRMV